MSALQLNRFWPTFLLIAPFFFAAALSVATAQEGITEPVVFPPFDPAAAACTPPPGLKSALEYIQENERDFLQGVDHGLSLAAKDRGLAYSRVVVENDVAKAVAEIGAFQTSGAAPWSRRPPIP